MADTIRPRDLPPVTDGIVNPTAATIVDGGGQVQRATPQQLVDAAAPIVSQAEAEAGTLNAKRVTPLRVAQYILAQTGGVALGAALGGKAATNFDNVTAVDKSMNNDRSYFPVGNPAVTRTRIAFSANDKYDGEREFTFSWGANFSHGGSGNSTFQWDKALLYGGVSMTDNCRNAWAANYLIQVGASVSSLNYVNCLELDVNMDHASVGTGIGQAGLGIPSVYNLTLNGLGNTITGALGIISSNPTDPLYQHGIVIGSHSCVQDAIFDTSSATYSYWDNGSHNIGLNMDGNYATAAIRIPNGVSISSRTTSGGIARMLNLDNMSNLRVGDPANNTNVTIERTLLPGADNMFQCGSSLMRWSSVWAANGTIQTSDASLKTDITPIDPDKVSIFFDALTPKSWRWIVGGNEPVFGTEEQMVEVGTEKKTIKMRRRVRSPQGVGGDNAFTSVDEDMEIDVPITELRDVPVLLGHKEVAGKRTHFGALAGDVKAAVDEAGFEDFGGYIKGDDGVEALRPDQLLALAMVEIKSLRKRVASLEGVLS
jgi:hypothetical protein